MKSIALFLACAFWQSQTFAANVEFKLPVTRVELETIAAALVLEAGGEGAEGMQAVLNVVMNRSKARDKSLYAVVIQRGQFTALNGILGTGQSIRGRLAKARAHPAWPLACEMVQSAYEGGVPDITGGATYYHRSDIRPYWRSSVRFSIVIGDHTFYAAAK